MQPGKLLKLFKKSKASVEERNVRPRNGAIVDFHFDSRRYRTYDAADGTIRVIRKGKPFKVTPVLPNPKVRAVIGRW